MGGWRGSRERGGTFFFVYLIHPGCDLDLSTASIAALQYLTISLPIRFLLIRFIAGF